jgi:16S rRNA (cytosine1402-N4)-methyltransferase
LYAHTPVMLRQVLACLEIEGKDIVVDCTLGEGGHTSHFLQLLKEGMLVGIEQDSEILQRAQNRLKGYNGRFVPVRDNFSRIGEILDERVGGQVDKIFFDLGISMFHIKESGRGFTFAADEPLDMRLDLGKSLSARDIVNSFDRGKLAQIIWAYGEERFSNQIAQRIVRERSIKPITTSGQLADIVERAIHRKFWPKNIHPATRTFQAIRIFVNDEIEILERAFRSAIASLKPGGRICVISFHSLEDRIAKSVFNDLARGCSCPPDFPVCVCGGTKVLKLLTKKPLMPDEGEIRTNPASRSARLRCALKLKDSAGTSPRAEGEKITA